MTVPQPVQEPLKVMSFNIRYGTANDGPNHWSVRRPRTIAVIQKNLAPLIGLQETLDFQIEELKVAFPGYASLGVGRDDGQAKGEFSAILYDTKRLRPLRSDTFWFSDTPTVPGSRHWGNNVTRICTWAFFHDLKTGRYFYLYNLHLDHESQPSREKAVDLLLKQIKERSTGDPVIVTGDFNVGEANPVIAKMKGAGFSDTFRTLHPDAVDVGTFNAFQELGKEKIDYVFADSVWAVKEAEIVKDKIDGRWPSDHTPVVAVLISK
jgi:endonuclease/exonuclease/phosphatase family metal-dependent hydrolase